MPGRDRSGPMGRGAMTGKGLGPCGGGYGQGGGGYGPSRGAWGMRSGRSMGMGMRNRGRGSALSFRSGMARFGRGFPFFGNRNSETEKQALKEEADMLGRQLKNIQDRLSDLEASSPETSSL